MREAVIEAVVAHVPSLPMVTVILSTLPILELRGALPVALLAPDPLPLWQAYPLAVFGNMIPIPFIIWFLEPATDFLRRWRLGDRFVEWLFARTRRKGKNIEKYETWGLILFVAIPLPVTGAWTGSVAGHVFGLRKVRTLLACFAGACIAGVIMTLLSVFAREFFERFFGYGATP
ncbi:MAG TPA: small multi-drug export protein [Candidatus Hydrogenedentes bacterium]|nr:small multi-drug export protein [Candidatus Hydrogenedentota bacterium]HIJ74665.1 small multi-drug export protein [Candidatus Hydrogenedentota bacterium]